MLVRRKHQHPIILPILNIGNVSLRSKTSISHLTLLTLYSAMFADMQASKKPLLIGHGNRDTRLF